MTGAPTFDGEARAELLCYLVVGQLVARAHRRMAPNRSPRRVDAYLAGRQWR